MELHKGQGHQTRRGDLASQEHPLPGDKDIFEDGQRLHHFVFGTDGILEVVSLEPAIGTGQELQPFGGHRQGEGHGVVLIALAHGPGRQDNDFVRIGGDRGVDLGSAYHDAVVAPVNNAHIIVRMVLALGAHAAVPFDIALGHGHRIIIIPTQLIVFFDPLAILSRAVLGHFFGNNVQRQERVRANLFNQNNQRGSLTGTGGNQTAALEQVFGVLGQVIITGIFLAGLRVGDHRQVAVARVFGHLIVDAGVLNGLADNRVGGDIVNFFTAIIDFPAVFQASLCIAPVCADSWYTPRSEKCREYSHDRAAVSIRSVESDPMDPIDPTDPIDPIDPVDPIDFIYSSFRRSRVVGAWCSSVAGGLVSVPRADSF